MGVIPFFMSYILYAVFIYFISNVGADHVFQMEQNSRSDPPLTSWLSHRSYSSPRLDCMFCITANGLEPSVQFVNNSLGHRATVYSFSGGLHHDGESVSYHLTRACQLH